MHYSILNTATKLCIAATMLLPSTGFGDGRRFVQRSTSCGHHVQQQIVEYPQFVQQEVYYFVGQPLRVDSLLRLEKSYRQELAADDRLQQEFKEFQAWRQKQSSNIQHYKAPIASTQDCPTCQKYPPVSETTPETPPTETTDNTPPDNPVPPVGTSLFVQKCGSCHGGNTPKAQLTLSLDTTLNLAMNKKCISMMDSGKMPKGGPPLTAAEADQIKSELLQITQ